MIFDVLIYYTLFSCVSISVLRTLGGISSLRNSSPNSCYLWCFAWSLILKFSPGCGGFGCRYCRWCFGPSLGWGSFSSWAFACWLMRRGVRPRGLWSWTLNQNGDAHDWIGCWDVPFPRYGAVWHCMTWNDQSKRIMTGISSSYCNSRIAQNMKYCVTICAMCYWYIRICSNTLWGPDLARARTCMDAWNSHICHDKRPIVSFQDSSSSIPTSGARTQCSIEPQQGYPDSLWFRPTVRSYCISMYFLVLVVLVGLVVFCLGQGVMLFVLTISYLQVLSPFLSPGISKVDPKRILLTSWKSARMVLSPAEWSGIRIGSFAFVIIKTPIITRALQEARQEKLGWFCHFGWYSIKMVHDVTISISSCSRLFLLALNSH